jgi:dUTP pyrophosphatase
MKIKFQRLRENAIVPTKATVGSAAFDLYCDSEIFVDHSTVFMATTGIAIEMPSHYCGLVIPRSGLAKNYGITVVNSPGLIDPDYRGEIMVLLTRVGMFGQLKFPKGTRIAQLLITPCLNVDVEVGEITSSTKRGTGGFGSTGV